MFSTFSAPSSGVSDQIKRQALTGQRIRKGQTGTTNVRPFSQLSANSIMQPQVRGELRRKGTIVLGTIFFRKQSNTHIQCHNYIIGIFSVERVVKSRGGLYLNSHLFMNVFTNILIYMFIFMHIFKYNLSIQYLILL